VASLGLALCAVDIGYYSMAIARLVMAALCLAPCAGTNAHADDAGDITYRFERAWPTENQSWYFSSPRGVAIDVEGNVLLVDGGIVKKLSSDGILLAQWGSSGSGDGEFQNPNGIAADTAGSIFVADTDNHRIQKFSSTGEFLQGWGENGSGEGQLQYPLDVAVSTTGSILVTDSGNNRVQKFTTDGVFIQQWDAIDPLFLEGPKGIAVDIEGNVYITKEISMGIQKFSADGLFLLEFEYPSFPGLGSPTGIIADPMGGVYVSTGTHVLEFDSNGKFAEIIGEFPSERIKTEVIPPFRLYGGLALGANELLYLSNTINARVQVLTTQGATITGWSSRGVRQGEFDFPLSISIDPVGNMYIADTLNQRIQKTTTDGQFLAQWGMYGAEEGQLVLPTGIASDSVGDVYVSVQGNGLIQKFSSEGELLALWPMFNDSESPDVVDIDCLMMPFPLFSPSPNGIAVAPSGEIYLVRHCGHRIEKYSADGVLILSWGSNGSGPGLLSFPRGVALSSQGNVFVADTGNYRIQEFTPDGEFLNELDMALVWDAPLSIAIDGDDNLFIGFDDRIVELSSEGAILAGWGSRGSGEGQFRSANGIALDSSGNVYVADSFNHRTQKFRPVVLTQTNRAIVVAGGGPYPGNNIWTATQATANFAYRSLMLQGFTPDEIYYLSSDTGLDLTNNGIPDVDADATALNLQVALTEWALEPLNDLPTGDVVVYLVDHGGPGLFRISGNEVVTAAELAQWLDTLEAGIEGTLTVIYDACESGSFLSALQRPNRIVITSSAAGENAYFLSTGAISFSTFFWTHVFNGLSVLDAFTLAEQAIGLTIAFQSPQLADPSSLAAGTFIGNGALTTGDRPEIGAVSASPAALGTGQTSATITADPVTDNDGIARVWAIVRPPDFFISDPSTPVQNLPSVELRPVAGTLRWEGVYSNFTVEGTYTIAVYARDRVGNTAAPQQLTVSVNTPLRRRALILAGGSLGDAQWPSTENAIRTAYRALRGQGYPNEDIRYYSAAATEGVDGANTKANLQNALTAWAAEDTQDLVVYLVAAGGGGNQSFRINATESVTALELAGWLNSLQETLPGRVTVVIDSPQSGTFVAPLAGVSRTVATSTGPDQAAAFIAGGSVSFSSYFWRQILNGAPIESAFLHARNAMRFSSGGQSALLDDNGNGIPNEPIDGAASRHFRLGAGIMLAADDPLISGVMHDTTLNSGSNALLWVENVMTTGQINEVFAVITPPGFTATKALRSGAERVTLPLIPANGNRYEAEYADFRTEGEYEIAFFAIDDRGNVALPKTSKVIQTQDFTGDGTAPDAFEPDNTPSEAQWIGVDGPGQTRNFHVPGDEDWILFYTPGNEILTIETFDLGPNSNTRIELYDETGMDLLDSDDNSGPGAASFLLYLFEQEGFYLLRVTHATGGFGQGTEYSIRIIREIGIIQGGIIGVVQNLATGVPIPNAEIQWRGRQVATTASDGTYAIDLLPAGSYTITVNAPGFLSMNRSLQIGSQLVEASFSMTPQGSISADINGDGVVNAVDVQLVINAALGIPSEHNADVNGDGVVNAVDVQLVINAALGIGLNL